VLDTSSDQSVARIALATQTAQIVGFTPVTFQALSRRADLSSDRLGIQKLLGGFSGRVNPANSQAISWPCLASFAHFEAFDAFCSRNGCVYQ
jgi:hypothetical protein